MILVRLFGGEFSRQVFVLHDAKQRGRRRSRRRGRGVDDALRFPIVIKGRHLCTIRSSRNWR